MYQNFVLDRDNIINIAPDISMMGFNAKISLYLGCLLVLFIPASFVQFSTVNAATFEVYPKEVLH